MLSHAFIRVFLAYPLCLTFMSALGWPVPPNRYSRRMYVAYTTFWVVGSLLAMQVGWAV